MDLTKADKIVLYWSHGVPMPKIGGLSGRGCYDSSKALMNLLKLKRVWDVFCHWNREQCTLTYIYADVRYNEIPTDIQLEIIADSDKFKQAVASAIMEGVI